MFHFTSSFLLISISTSVCRRQAFERGAHDVSSVSWRRMTRGGERAAVCTVIRAAGLQPELLSGHDDWDLTRRAASAGDRHGEVRVRQTANQISDIWSFKHVDVCVMIGGRRCFRAVSQAMCSPPPGSVVVCVV